MASDQQGLPAPYATARVALDATATNATKVTLPTWCHTFTVTFLTSGEAATTGEISHTGTDGAAMGTGAFPLASGATIALQVRDRASAGGTVDVYLICGGASGFAQIICEAGY